MLVKVMIFHTLLYITAHPRKKQNGRDYFCAVFFKAEPDSSATARCNRVHKKSYWQTKDRRNCDDNSWI